MNFGNKTLKKAKSLTWDNSTWEAQILPSITKELEKLDVQDGKPVFPSSPREVLNNERLLAFTNLDEEVTDDYRQSLLFSKRRSPLGRTQSVRTMIPPPGFEEVEAKRDSCTADAQASGKSEGLKRCVTFAGVIPKHYALQGAEKDSASKEDHANEGTRSTLNETSRTLKRIDSARMVRQAFPKTIFDNSDSNLVQSHNRTKSDTFFPETGRRSTRAGSVSSIVSDASTSSTATSASNAVLITNGFGTTTPPSVDQPGAYLEPGSPALDFVPQPQQGHPEFPPYAQEKHWSNGWSGASQQGYVDPSCNPATQQYPQQQPYPSLPNQYPGSAYSGLDQQQQIALIQQQVMHNQMMFRWMMQQQQGMPPGQGAMPGRGMPQQFPNWPTGPQQQTGYSQTSQPYNERKPYRQRQFTPPGPKNDKHQVYREQNNDSLLMRHKNSGYRPSFSELLGNVVEFSRDSHGSRFVQYMMETASPENRQLLINEVLEEAVSLMQDLFGNYVMQNFLEHGTSQQRISLARSIEGNMMLLSLQAHGCRVVQRAIDTLPVSNRNELLREIVSTAPRILRCAKDPHATHVLQKAIILLHKDQRSGSANDLSKELLTKIQSAVAEDVLILSVHPNACRLVQRVLGDCVASRSTYIASVLSLVVASYHTLAIDQHGNFIMQHILDNGDTAQVASVQDFVCSRVLELSQHKFGSHLVEKCLQSATAQQTEAIVKELLNPSGHNEEYKNSIGNDRYDHEDRSTLLLLMKDPYANFVVQRAFDASSGELKGRLASEIRARGHILNKFTYGRHILAHIHASGA